MSSTNHKVVSDKSSIKMTPRMGGYVASENPMPEATPSSVSTNVYSGTASEAMLTSRPSSTVWDSDADEGSVTDVEAASEAGASSAGVGGAGFGGGGYAGNLSHESSFVIAIVASTLMALATENRHKCSETHLVTTRYFLNSIKDDDFVTPINVQGLLDHVMDKAGAGSGGVQGSRN